jgi:hypothetical protein
VCQRSDWGRCSFSGIERTTESVKKTPQLVTLGSVSFPFRESRFSRARSGNQVDALNVKSVTVFVHSSNNPHPLVLVLPRHILVIELVRRIVSSFEDVFFTLPNDDACNALPGRLRLGVRIWRLRRLRVGVPIGRSRWFRSRLRQRNWHLKSRPCYQFASPSACCRIRTGLRTPRLRERLGRHKQINRRSANLTSALTLTMDFISEPPVKRMERSK